MTHSQLFKSVFIAGFECSSHRRADGRRLDLLAATRHDQYAAEDYRQLGSHGIRCNTVHPTGVNSPMVVNDAFSRFIEEHPETADSMQNLLPVPLIEAYDISNAIVFLSSEEGRYITGVTLPVDGGMTAR